MLTLFLLSTSSPPVPNSRGPPPAAPHVLQELAECQTMEIHRLAPAGAPVFSLCQPDDKLASFDAAAAITTSSSSSAAAADRVRPIFCGTAAKEVVTLSGVGLPPAPGAPTTGPTVSDKVQLRDHTGWVRSLAASGKWLFSCGCNYVKVWDTTWPLPREAHTAKLFTGDILCLVAGVTLGPNGLSPVPRVYACCTNGCLAAWDVDKQGKLKPVGSRDKAHAGRATCLLAAGNFLYSVGSDGALRAWSADKLELVMEVAAAHDGQRINALALGPDGLLYTGGDDKLVRRWSPGLLEPVAEPLYAHTAAVKVLAAGLGEVVLSGDASGEACLWYV